METQELLTIVVTTLATIAAYSLARDPAAVPVSYTHLTLPTTTPQCRSRWSPDH